MQIYTRNPGASFLGDTAKASCRLPGGHPEAFFEAFGNVYRSAYDDMVLRASGEQFERVDTIYPNVYDGVEGMFFIQQCVASSKADGQSLPLKHPRARR
jgi:hypothetical protein